MKKITIGSNPNCDITIGSQEIGVSFLHAFITNNNDETWTLEDVSRNGTYINGEKIHQNQCIVRCGDEIEMAGIPLSWAEIIELTQESKTYLDIQPLVYGPPPPCIYGPPIDNLSNPPKNRSSIIIIVIITIIIICALGWILF